VRTRTVTANESYWRNLNANNSPFSPSLTFPVVDCFRFARDPVAIRQIGARRTHAMCALKLPRRRCEAALALIHEEVKLRLCDSRNANVTFLRVPCESYHLILPRRPVMVTLHAAA
jgi:hypothetical protein